MSDSPDHNDEIQQIWDDQHIGRVDADPQQIANAMKAAHKKEQKMMRRLVIQEVIPAVGIAAYFFWVSSSASTTLRQVALLGAALISLGVGGFLLASARRQRATEQVFGASLGDELERRRSQLVHRAKLYRTVGWWYLGPLTVAIVLAYLGLRPAGEPRLFDLGYGISVIVLLAVLYVVNRRVGRDRYETELQSVSSLIADLAT